MLSERSAANSAAITKAQEEVQKYLITDEEKQAYEQVGKIHTEALALLKRVPR